VNWLACELRKNWIKPPDLVRIEPEVVSGYPDGIVLRMQHRPQKLRESARDQSYNPRSQ
jgi:hypothetical protein